MVENPELSRQLTVLLTEVYFHDRRFEQGVLQAEYLLVWLN